MKRSDLIGQVFGRLTVIRFVGLTKTRQAIWACNCECGGTVGHVVTGTLRSGHTQSCGCYQKARASQGSFKHGQSHTPLHNLWTCMRDRCNNPKHDDYHLYGGRGIKVCERWNVFLSFAEDMGKKPGRKYTIDRKDNNGPYSPENCRWATQVQQARNRRSNRLLEHNGEILTATEWATRTGIHMVTICSRLRLGWTVDEALTTPARPMPNRKRLKV